jgi:hypothetical protein
LFSVIVLARLCVFGIAMSIRKVFFVFLFVKAMSGRLEGIVLSVIMLRFQYSLKLSSPSCLLVFTYSTGICLQLVQLLLPVSRAQLPLLHHVFLCTR